MKKRWLFMAILVATTLLVIASCSLTNRGSSAQDLSGGMLLWHALNTNESEPLKQVIDSFTALYPGVNLKVQVFSTTVELEQQFVNAADAGLGPDLILAPSTSAPLLVAAHSLAPVDAYLTEAIIARFNPTILATLQFDGKSYGLPQSLDTMGLFVNRQLVGTPTTTLPALLEQANSGATVLMPINFADAYWGLSAFGGQLFNEDEMAVLDQGGFANWLAWLREARNAPGMIQDTNRDALRQRFMAGDAGYYIGYASELTQILAALDPTSVEVYPLPSGPVGQAGPLVTSRAFLFSSASSENQRRLAAEFAKFVTNSEQSSRLMRLAYQIPANINVRINPRLYPIVAPFVAQARSGIPKPMNAQFDTATRLGNEAYVRALEGGESPTEVAFSVNDSINVANGFEVQAAPTFACRNLGQIHFLVTWQDETKLAVLDSSIEQFRAACSLITVERVEANSRQIESAMTIPSGGRGPTVVSLMDRRQIGDLLLTTPGVLNLDTLISNETLQRFVPIAIEAMRVNGRLYGLPLTMDVDVFYYNRDMVVASAQTLDDLRTQANAGIPITLDTNFERAFWGMRAFGAQPFASSGASILDQGGMADWLNWLVESRDVFGIQLSDDSEAIRQQFLNGETAYYVGGADELETLLEVMGDALQVTLLPSGPSGPAQPLVTVEGLAVRADASESSRILALDFMSFMTDLPNQSRLMDDANLVHTNGSVSIANEPFLSVFFEQAQTGYLLPGLAQSLTLLELAPTSYKEVLEDGRDATEVVSELAAAINKAHDIVVTPTPMPTLIPTVAPIATPMAENTPSTSGGQEIKAE